jgi:2-oxoisovalerate dehydrogenase E1 component alpha subunit
MAIQDVSLRAASYGIAGVTVDGFDPIAVYQAVREARERAIAGDGPTLIEAKVYRYTPHSSDDDDRMYRPREEVADALARDPIPAFARRLRELGALDDGDELAIQQSVDSEVDAAVEAADARPQPRADDLLTHVFAEPGDPR